MIICTGSGTLEYRLICQLDEPNDVFLHVLSIASPHAARWHQRGSDNERVDLKTRLAAKCAYMMALSICPCMWVAILLKEASVCHTGLYTSLRRVNRSVNDRSRTKIEMVTCGLVTLCLNIE